MKKDITISHIHVWDKKNKGDFAIVLAVQELLLKKFKGAKIINFAVETLKEFDNKKIAKINSSDFVIMGGGGIFYSYFLPFDKKTIDSIKVPIFLFGLGYIKEVDAPLWPKKHIDSVVYLVNKASGVGVRDLNTKRFLIENGGKTKKIKVIGDPAIALSDKKPKTDVIKRLHLGNRKVKIGLNLNYSGWLGFGKWHDEIIESYLKIINYFENEFNAEIYYIKHHPGENNIYPKLNIKKSQVIDLHPNEQMYVYKKLDLIIGMMLHVGVMSFGAITPEISLAYDIRNYGFAEFINQKELVVNLSDLSKDELLLRAKQVFSKRNNYKNIFEIKRKKIIEKQMNFLSGISF